MCKLVNINFVEGRYKLWLNSLAGGTPQQALAPMYKIKFVLPPIYNIDPKFTQSLIFVKSVWKGQQEVATTDSFWTFMIEGKPLPNNCQSRADISIDGQNASCSSNSKIICKFPIAPYMDFAGAEIATYKEFEGNVIDNGILVGDTFVNGGSITLTLIGNTGIPIADVQNVLNHYELELDIQLVENTKN